jgi:hypothetical protein
VLYCLKFSVHRFSLILRWSLIAMNDLRVGFGTKKLMNIHDMQLNFQREREREQKWLDWLNASFSHWGTIGRLGELIFMFHVMSLNVGHVTITN